MPKAANIPEGELFGESARAHLGTTGEAYYEKDLEAAVRDAARDATFPKVIKAAEMVWEDSPHGRIKHLARPEMNPRVKEVEAYMQEIPPGGRSGKHRHMAEEYMLILSGHGYSLHWDVDAEFGETFVWKTEEEPKRFDWEAGDWVYVPVNTVHQHFNSDEEKPARFISAASTIYRYLGWHDLEQLESAPPAH